jgi:hypothetical protein
MAVKPAQQRTGQAPRKGASGYGAASRGPWRVARRRRATAAGRRRRRPLLFYALTASFAGELAAIVADEEALVVLFSLTTLFLCAVVFQAAKT